MAEDPPLAVDIDGTLTREDRSVDSRVLDVLREWDAPVVVATGKALPYPVALCQFVGVEPCVVAENGGVAYVDDELVYFGDRRAADRVAAEFEDETGDDLGWGDADLTNRWRETELAVRRDRPLDVLSEIAERHGRHVVDTGFAYHVKGEGTSKGDALPAVARRLGVDVTDFAAVGDSANDVELFETVGESYAVGNADDHATDAAGEVLSETHGDGFLAAVERIRSGT